MINNNNELLANDLRAFIHTDLLCYFVGSPAELAQEQKKSWEPVLAWAEKRYGIKLLRTAGVMPLTQPEAVQKSLAGAIDAHAALLEPLYRLTRAYGSLLLALAVLEKRLNAVEAFHLSRLDETFQNRAWGVDEEAEAREKAVLAEVERIALTLP